MKNFTYQNPVRIHFGKGQIAQLKNELPKGLKVLITYGGGSIKKNGVYQQVMDALKHCTVFEFSGIEPNPHYETLMKAVQLIREKKIDFVLAVGGGSVIDGTKFIVAAVPFKGEPWDILQKHAPIQEAIPFGCVLTIPATASEMNCGAVITKASTQDKLHFINPLVFPKFSILDPSVTFSLPANQTAYGIVDAFVHVMEQYLTYPVNSPLQDRFAEGILLTLVSEGPKAIENPQDYDVRANVMLSAMMGLNGLIACGVPEDWATHMLGHEITAMFGLDHAQTLAIVLPSVMRLKKNEKREKLLQYAARIWSIASGTEDERIEKAIQHTRDFFEELGIKTHLSDYGIKARDAVPRLIQKLDEHHMIALGEKGDIDLKVSTEILELCA